MFEPGEKIRIAEYMVEYYRSYIDDEVKEGTMTPERKELCLKALEASVININGVIFDGANSRWETYAK